MGCVAIQFEMLTYLKYAPLPNRIDALPSNTTWGFETTSNYIQTGKPANLFLGGTFIDKIHYGFVEYAAVQRQPDFAGAAGGIAGGAGCRNGRL